MYFCGTSWTCSDVSSPIFTSSKPSPTVFSVSLRSTITSILESFGEIGLRPRLRRVIDGLGYAYFFGCRAVVVRGGIQLRFVEQRSLSDVVRSQFLGALAVLTQLHKANLFALKQVLPFQFSDA